MNLRTRCGFCLGLVALAIAGVRTLGAQTLPSYTPTATDLQFLSTLEQAEVQYFIDQAQSPYYLMPDTWATTGPDTRCTDEDTGLELVALCIADSHGWIPSSWTPRVTALGRVRTILTEMATIQTQTLAQYPASGGLFFHYMYANGTRYGTSNIGTDDGARFLNGALTARQYFNDPTVTGLVNQIYAKINWQAWVDSSNQEAYEAWTPNTSGSGGTFGSYWGRYSEGPLQVYLLGMGSPASPPLNYGFNATNWKSWTRGPLPANSYAIPQNSYGVPAGTYTWIGVSPALFIHQYPQAFLYLNGLWDTSPGALTSFPVVGVNYWNNSVSATLAEWQWSQDISQNAVAGVGPFPDWGVNLWGLTSSNSQNYGYATWGGPLPTSPEYTPDGTLTPEAAGGSLPFTPAQSLQTLEYMYKHYPSTWLSDPLSDPVTANAGHAYGFADAFNVEESPAWYDNQFSTNGAGQTLIMAENYTTGLVWRMFMSSPEIISALNMAQMAGTGTVAAPVFSLAPGNYVSGQSVTISTGTAVASIRYTTDGSTPSEAAGTLYSGAIAINAATTLKAIAFLAGFGDSPITSGTYTIGTPPSLLSATSSLTQGSAGTFALAAAWTATSAAPAAPYPVECRASANLNLVLTFNQSMASAQASLGSGTATVGTPVCSGTQVAVPLTGVANAQTLVVDLTNLAGGGGGVLAAATVGLRVLAGDVNGDGVVDISDINLVRASSGAAVGSSNFQYDVNGDGSIDISDINLVRAASGTAAP